MKKTTRYVKCNALAQSEKRTAEKNKVAKKGVVSKKLNIEILNAVENEDFDKDIWQLTEREIEVYYGTKWADPTSNFLKQSALCAFINGVLKIPIKIDDKPSEMEMRCKIVDSELDVHITLLD